MISGMTLPARLAAVAVVAALALGACGRGPERVAGPLATAPVQQSLPVSPGTTAAAARGLPDFTELVSAYGPAVVNVTVVERTRPVSADSDTPDDPLHEFLRRFGADLLEECWINGGGREPFWESLGGGGGELRAAQISLRFAGR